MLEQHPFGNFVPNNAIYLMIGSFPTKPSDNFGWFYSSRRSQFWPIMELVYKRQLRTVEQKQQLYIDLKMALTDIILSCERKNNSNLDTNLYNITYNMEGINNIINDLSIQKIFFTSKFVEKTFNKLFLKTIANHPEIEIISLPSPSPRYAVMSLKQKALIYSKLLPSENSII